MDGALLSGFMLFAALFFVALNGVFVLAEFSFATIRSTKVEGMVREGRAGAGIVQEATRKLDAYLAVCQLGITISSLSLGALGEPAIASLIEPLFETWGVPEALMHPVAFAIGFFIITSLHVVLGELVPKSIGIQEPEASSLFIAPFMKFFYYLFLPLMIVFNGTGNAIVRAFGIAPASETNDTHTEDEVRMIIAQSRRSGTLGKRDEAMLEGVFELGETVAREVMVPRPDVAMLPAEMPLSELATAVATGNHTRYPLFEDGDTERIIGAVHAKDVLRAAEAARSFEEDIAAWEMMRELITVPENRSIEDILAEFQRRKIHMAVVIDEWGSFEGIVTIEDILEEVVGEIWDEFDAEEAVIKQTEDGGYAVEGRTQIKAVNEALGADFESEDFDTIGGLVLGLLGRPPELGDEVRLKGYALRVDGVEGSRVVQLTARMEERPPEPCNGKRRVVLSVDGADPDEHEDIAHKVDKLLSERPEAEIELMNAPAARKTSGREGSLLSILANKGLCVAVRGYTVRVWRASEPRRRMVKRDGRSAIRTETASRR